MGVLIPECKINQARKGTERMLEEIVGSRERKTKIEKYSPFRGLGKSSEAWSNPLLAPTGRLIIVKAKQKQVSISKKRFFAVKKCWHLGNQ